MSTILGYIENFLSSYQHYQTYWNYEDGCVLMGCKQLYEATQDKVYLDFILQYLEQVIEPDGNINNYELGKYNIDSINSGKVLFTAYEITKEEKYKSAIEFIMNQLREHPRTESGNFYHKQIYPKQIWLDGVYMALPFYMEYETKYDGKEHYNDILNQVENVRKFLYDEEKTLYYHAYDEARVQLWADKVTGCSPNFWLRSMGWYLMALVDIMEAMSQEIYEQYRRYEELLKEAVTGILKYQDPDTKLFYQVIDRADVKENYTETSGSAMIAYAIIKGCRLHVLSAEKYAPIGEEVLQALIRHKLLITNQEAHLTDICQVAGLGPGEARDGSVEYYLSEPRVSDDSKGVGPFMMAYAQSLLFTQEHGMEAGMNEKK